MFVPEAASIQYIDNNNSSDKRPETVKDFGYCSVQNKLKMTITSKIC